MTTVKKLNVGGISFSTTKHTLSKSKYLANLVDRDWWTPNSKNETDQEIFIDRDGFLFRYILLYLRSGQIDIEDRYLKGLKEEAKFYLLNDMVQEIENMLCHINTAVNYESIMDQSQLETVSNISIEYNNTTNRSLLPPNENGYKILTTIHCLRKVYKCPRNIQTHTEPFRCSQTCEKVGLIENSWTQEEEKMFLVSRNK